MEGNRLAVATVSVRWVEGMPRVSAGEAAADPARGAVTYVPAVQTLGGKSVCLPVAVQTHPAGPAGGRAAKRA